jgi:7-cyano-7-deazaguanine reductase
MGMLDESTLGKATTYRDRYDPGVLLPVPRAAQRMQLGLGTPLPFHGVDIWNAYELSWLGPRGQPRVAIAEFRVPAASPNLIESKSFKLYLNGFAQEHIDEPATLVAILARDLSAAAGNEVAITLHAADAPTIPAGALAGLSLDTQDLAIDCYGPPQPEYLRTAVDATPVSETLVSHLLRSNCPVTGQPDWGSVQIRYTGPPIDHAGLLRYIVSFRRHSEFHEHCVERMFVDLMQRCAPGELSVHARYTRRGGLDINPFRSTSAAPPGNLRTPRQ